VIGLLREMVIAYVAGAGGAVDAYQVAFVAPELLNHMVASGFLSVTFIPIFSRYLTQDNEDKGWRVMSVILSCFGPVLAAAILVAMTAAPEIVGLVAPGLQDPVLKASAARMTRIILPAQSQSAQPICLQRLCQDARRGCIERAGAGGPQPVCVADAGPAAFFFQECERLPDQCRHLRAVAAGRRLRTERPGNQIDHNAAVGPHGSALTRTSPTIGLRHCPT
jgi:hypothetical protein